MSIKNNTPIERIIAKLDNDFNIDNDDWIPRVYAWVIDALSILNLKINIKRRKLIKVENRLAIIPDDVTKITKVTTVCGCEVPNIKLVKLDKGTITPPYGLASSCTYNENKERLGNKNYIIANDKYIDLNFDTNKIIIEYDTPDYYENERGCKLPIIPDNGMLIEGLTNYCMYKILSRGYKHPVMNLSASNYGTNPYVLWKQDINKIKTSVNNQLQELNSSHRDNNIFGSWFYISTFDSRR